MLIKDDRYFFASYSHQDKQTVHYVIRELEKRGFNIWADTRLQPGENWQRSISYALENAFGLIIFLSSASLQSKWVTGEFQQTTSRGAPIIPAVLEHTPLPEPLRALMYIDLSGDQLESGIDRLSDALTFWLGKADYHSANLELPLKEIERFAEDAAQEARGTPPAAPEDQAPPTSVFIVHGHDTQLLDEVEAYIKTLGIKPIVLTKISTTSQQPTLIEKFLSFGNDARYAVVLMSADDRGASNRQYDTPNVGDKALQFRARQNVILELGFFYGHLGFENVFVLFKPSAQVFPNFERPSDLDGVLFDTVDSNGQWKDALKKRLQEAGFQLP
jgi:predicted nucleotide-binding protein